MSPAVRRSSPNCRGLGPWLPTFLSHLTPLAANHWPPPRRCWLPGPSSAILLEPLTSLETMLSTPWSWVFRMYNSVLGPFSPQSYPRPSVQHVLNQFQNLSSEVPLFHHPLNKH